jgi:hypothetical protein
MDEEDENTDEIDDPGSHTASSRGT